MSVKFPEYKNFDLSQINKDILGYWKENNTFEKSLTSREGNPSFVFFEGPPSANGIPGIHHVMARTIKDIICRYKTLQGFHVKRKAGWDTHGLPVELGVEKMLKITKEDIGTKVSVDEYNAACRKEVMKYTDLWEDLTHSMGYWINMDEAYITYDNRYIESVWHLLKELFKKDMLYKGYSIQPFSPAAGTGLSTHELNQPGCYRDVKDTTCVAMFTIVKNEKSDFLFDGEEELSFLAWTTTPWTLLSNTALAVGGKINYLKVKTFNPYSGKPITVILAKDRLTAYFSEKSNELKLEDYKVGDKNIPYQIVGEYKGSDLNEVRYEQLMPYMQPEEGDAFRVLVGDFVTTEDGTGIVHIAPSFGADDFRVAQQNGVGALTMVDRQGRFIKEAGEFAGRYVKNEFDESLPKDATTVDVDIAVKLKKENKAFKIEKYVHSYPHCWRTDKPVLYYPLDSWFIRTTAVRERMMELNDTINWKPQSTGTGRFGKWLENLVDWNLSRSRYWGTPLPIWATEDREELKCIGSVGEMKAEIEKAIAAGYMTENPFAEYTDEQYNKENYTSFDLHRPYVDDIYLVSESGKKMTRETDLIDVWFDSGAMPYAQMHYPFENKEGFNQHYPADFIAEGVDQTRGWFFTLHAISVMLFDSVAFKNIISNGLVLDAQGQKMSKRLNNGIDPFKAIDKYGSDPLRWYMITNSPPWENLKFDIGGVDEVKRKFFGTLYNTYSFFSLYANVDNFTFAEEEIPLDKRPEIDRWVLSLLNTLIKDVGAAYESYEPTKAGRAIQNFVIENLSNWYVRLNRKRFWGGSYDESKISAYQTLYTCLLTISKLASPIAPFYMEQLYQDLINATNIKDEESVHLTDFPTINEDIIDVELEERMAIAQRVSSMVLGLRRKVSLKVRQPLNKIMVPVLDDTLKTKIEAVKNIILTEVNVKDIEYITDTTGILVKKIKANFKLLGRKFGKQMKMVAGIISKFNQDDIANIERDGKFTFDLEGVQTEVLLSEVEIMSEDIPGWEVASEGHLTVALDINLSEELKQEGVAREFVNRIQNIRKDSGFEVTDKIKIQIQKHEAINTAITNFEQYISSQTLAVSINLVDEVAENSNGIKCVELENDVNTNMSIELA